MGGREGKDNIDMEEWYEWCVIGRGLPNQSIWISKKCLLGGGTSMPIGRQVERQTALAISCPAPEVWQSQCGGGLSMGQQCDRCGGIDRWDDEARGGGSTRGGALGPGGCYSYSLQVGEENQSLSTVQQYYVTSACHTLVVEERPPP